MDVSEVLKWFFNIIDTEVITILSLWFCLGFILACVGLFALYVFIWSRVKGRKVKGKLVGAFKRVRVKQKTRDGKPYEKVKTTIWPIFEYKSADGEPIQEVGSENVDLGNDKYKTGQIVNLLVCSHKEYDDVYDANKKASLYVGLIFIAIGGWLMSLMLIPYGFNAMFWISVIGTLSIGGYKLITFITSDTRESCHQRPKDKIFTADEVHPVEFFYKEKAKAKTET